MEKKEKNEEKKNTSRVCGELVEEPGEGDGGGVASGDHEVHQHVTEVLVIQRAGLATFIQSSSVYVCVKEKERERGGQKQMMI